MLLLHAFDSLSHRNTLLGHYLLVGKLAARTPIAGTLACALKTAHAPSCVLLHQLRRACNRFRQVLPMSCRSFPTRVLLVLHSIKSFFQVCTLDSGPLRASATANRAELTPLHQSLAFSPLLQRDEKSLVSRAGAAMIRASGEERRRPPGGPRRCWSKIPSPGDGRAGHLTPKKRKQH